MKSKGLVGKIEKIVDESVYAKNVVVSIAQKKALKQLKKISEESSNEYPKIDNPKTIIFNRVYSVYADSIFNEVGIAKALQLLGHNVKFYMCGGKLYNCSAVFTMKNPANKKRCETCIDFGKQFLSIMDIPFETYEDILKDKKYSIPENREERENYGYKGINAGRHAKTSADRFYLGLKPDKTKYDYNELLGQHLLNSLASIDVAEYSYKKDKPDILYSSHGCYSEWGGFLDYFNERNVRYIVWNYSFGKEYVFNQDDLSLTFKMYLKQKKSLNEQETKEIDAYIDNRVRGKSDTEIYGFKTDNKDLEKMFSFSKYDRVYTMFPNVLWDSSLAKVDRGFNSVYHWVDDTISFFKKNPQYLLIIKIHPGEKTQQDSLATSKEYILEKHALSDNISIIDIDTDISPYSLFKHIDSGLIYNGTIGLELSVSGIPAIVSGLSPYHNQGFTYDVDSVDEYRSILKNPPSKLDDKRKKLAKLFAYFYFIDSRVPITYVIYKNRTTITYDLNKFEDLLEKEEIKFAVDYILGTSFWKSKTLERKN